MIKKPMLATLLVLSSQVSLAQNIDDDSFLSQQNYLTNLSMPNQTELDNVANRPRVPAHKPTNQQTESEFIESECQSFGYLGRSAALYRQKGYTYEQALKLASYADAKHKSIRSDSMTQAITDLTQAYTLLIEDAYAQPIYPKKLQKLKEIEFRGDRAYTLCKEAMPLGRAKARQQLYSQ